MTALEYEQVRADPRWFPKLPEHELESGPNAHVGAGNGSHVVIENLGAAAEIAIGLDERARGHSLRQRGRASN